VAAIVIERQWRPGPAPQALEIDRLEGSIIQAVNKLVIGIYQCSSVFIL
jgi:hypothetical protein